MQAPKILYKHPLGGGIVSLIRSYLSDLVHRLFVPFCLMLSGWLRSLTELIQVHPLLHLLYPNKKLIKTTNIFLHQHK